MDAAVGKAVFGAAVLSLGISMFYLSATFSKHWGYVGFSGFVRLIVSVM